MIGLYAAYVAAAIFAHPTFIYPFDQTPMQRRGYTQTTVATPRGAMHLSYRDGDDAGPAILFFMGNTGA